MTGSCRECGKRRKPRDLAPLVRLADGTAEPICRRCFEAMVEVPREDPAPRWLRADWTFWMRQNGMDVRQEATP